MQQLIDADDLKALSELLVDLNQSLSMIQSLSFFQKQKARLDRYEQIILAYTKTKEDQVFMRQTNEEGTVSSQGKNQVPLS